MFYLISIIFIAKYKHYFRDYTYSALNVERKQYLNHQKSLPPEGERNSSDKSKQNRAKTQTSTTKKSALNKSIAPPTVLSYGSKLQDKLVTLPHLHNHRHKDPCPKSLL
jgi:hypothetical protein